MAVLMRRAVFCLAVVMVAVGAAAAAVVPYTSSTAMYYAEAETSLVCYARYPEATAIWNAMQMELPDEYLVNAPLQTFSISLLRTQLNAGANPCVAIERVLTAIPGFPKARRRSFRDACGVTILPAPLGNYRLASTSPILACLRAAHTVGLTAMLITNSEARATLVNSQSIGDSEVSVTFDGIYSTNFTRAVLRAVIAAERR